MPQRRVLALPFPPRRRFWDGAGDYSAESTLEVVTSFFAETGLNTGAVLKEQLPLHVAIGLEEAPGARSSKPALQTRGSVLNMPQRCAGANFAEHAAGAIRVRYRK